MLKDIHAQDARGRKARGMLPAAGNRVGEEIDQKLLDMKRRRYIVTTNLLQD